MNDFDFFIGTWDVNNYRRRDFLDESSAWEEFPGVSRATRHFDGRAHFDEIEFPTKGFSGLTLRLLNTQREEWSLYWASQQTGLLYPPVVGSFTDGRGQFYGNDTYKGHPIRARFIWSDITEHYARWEQAFSADDGSTWVINWIMEMTRR